MAENEIPAGAPLGNRTIKLSPISTASAGEAAPQQSESPSPTRTQAIPLKRKGATAIPLRPMTAADAAQPTATVQINRPAPKPVSTHSQPINTNSGPIPAVPKKMTVKPVTQSVPIQTQPPPAPMPAPAPAQVPDAEPPPVSTISRRVATATTRIKVTGMPTRKLDLTATTAIKTGLKPSPSAQTVKLNATPASAAASAPAAPAPAPAAADDSEQTRTVVINRKKVTPAEPEGNAAPPPLVAKAAPAGPLGTNTLNLNNISASGKTIKLGAAPAAPAPSDGLQPSGDNAQTASVKIGGIPSPAAGTVKLGSNPVTGTSSGIKLGTVTGSASGIKLGTVTGSASGIKLGTVTGSASGIKLGTVTGSASGIKLGTVTGSASGIKLSTAPGISAGSQPAPAASETPAAPQAPQTPAAPAQPPQASQASAAPGGLKIKMKEEPLEEKKEEAPANKAKENVKKAEQAKKFAQAKSVAEPNLFFSITSIVALIAVMVLTAIIAVQYLNLWEGMQIELPGLNFLTLGK